MGNDGNEEVEPPPFETADARFASNFRARRAQMGLSQQEVAERMTDEYGFTFHQQTVARVEKGTRGVHIGEAMALAQILKTDVGNLLTPSRSSLDSRHLFNTTQKVRSAYAALVDKSKTLIVLQNDLARYVWNARRLEEADDSSSTVAMNIRRAQGVSDYTPDAAFERAIHELSSEARHAWDDHDIDREAAGARPPEHKMLADLWTWLGNDLNRLLGRLTYKHRKLWRDPRTFLGQHLIMVAALSEGGYSVEEIADLLREEPEDIPELIADGKLVLDERIREQEEEDADEYEETCEHATGAEES